MKRKENSPEKKLERLVNELCQSYEKWQYYHDHGGSDPCYPDGVNMELICNHICYYKTEIKKLCEESGLPLPDDCNKPAPTKVPRNYMARPAEIYEHACASLVRYEENADYQYLIANGGKIDKEVSRKIHLPAICGYVSGLRSAIAKNDLVKMRIHECGDGYIDSFHQCAKRLRDVLEKNFSLTEQTNGQFCLF